uniref:WIZ zinc finger n=1 Tax=Monodelphis domestica TaxID=13616 RepID=A0A5F8GDH7_MONDO
MRPYFCDLVEEADKETLGQEEDPAVYTCIECSIYFKKKEHLLDHMMQHSRGPGQDPVGDSRGGQGQFSCSECGWAFGDPGTLEQHRRLHQESREKIIEEIQKLNEFPDEGRDARLQCPKCMFGTNSSKIFVQHAKMHVRDRRDQGANSLGLSGRSGGEAQDSAGHLAYKHFRSNELPIAQGPSLGLGKGLHSCILCGFPAPNENVLKEHVKYAHSHQPWGGDVEAFEDPGSQPGTSRDTYSPARLAQLPDMGYFGKADRLFAPPWQEASAHYDPTPAFALGHHRLERSGRVKRAFPTPSFHSRKMLPYSSTHKTLGTLPFSSAKVYNNPYILHPNKKKSMVHLKDLESDMDQDFLTGWEEIRPSGSYASDMGSMEEEMSTTEIDFPQTQNFNPDTIPQPALELKRSFRDALQKAESSEAQQHQLRKMVPIVLVEEMNLQPSQGPFQAPGQLAKPQGATSSTELMLDGPIPLDFLLLDSPLEGPLGIDDLFDSDSPMLKNEERKCPYCPDRFHNGIGLANHVRGHLNRVGVSYNVRHFISAEEVKAIEQKFSFQKKKKKVANFDPSTFSLMRCEFCGAGFDTRAGLSSHARAHLRDFGITNWELTISPINILKELLAASAERPVLVAPGPGEPGSPGCDREMLGFGPPTLMTVSECRGRGSPLSPFPQAWGDELGPIYRDVLASEEEEMVAVELAPPPLPKKSTLPPGQLEHVTSRLGNKMSPEVPHGSKQELPDLKASGPEPVRDIRCEFCGEFFENRKGLSSHARSHLRQMGVTEWYVNGSPIDTLREILKRRTQPRAGGPPNPTLPGPKGLAKAMGGGPGSSLEARSASDLHVPPPKKLQPSSSPMGHSPTTSPPPTARKMFPGLPPPSLQKKLKPDQMRMEIKREMLAGSLHSEGHPSDGPWSPREDMAPLNLSSRAEPVRDIRCEFCGEFFENRKGLSSHARSHLRQMGVTEWSVNGSPIDTLREILKKKSKPCLIKKEPAAGELPSPLGEDGPKSPGKVLQALSLTPLAGRPGKPGPGSANLPREMSLSPLATKPSAGFLTPMAAKRPLPEDRLLSGEMKPKTYIQTELPFKTKTIHDKSSHTSSEACCELCGLYFENRKALASHARAHLRQFGVTEWCVNGSPIETLSEWIKHRPQKVGAYRSYIQGGRPFTKKFRNSGHGRDGDKRVPLTLAPNSLTLVNKNLGGELGPGEAGRTGDGSGPLASSPLALVKAEEHQRQNINKFERRQARPLDTTSSRGEEASDFQQKLEEVRQPPPRVRPVPSLVPRPPQTSLVKFVGNIYTLKCRFCEVEFQGPLSIQEEWVRHLQRHILEMNFSKAEPRPVEPEAPEAQTVAEAQ